MDFDGLESAEATSWEARWALRQALAKADASLAEGFRPPLRPAVRADAAAAAAAAEPGAGAAPKVEVVARHALLGIEMRVVLPARAKFKHIKVALAKRLGSADFQARAQVIKKVNGIYCPYDDNARVGSVRRVLVVCPGVESYGADDMEAALSDAEVSAEEPEGVEEEEGEAEARRGESAQGLPAEVGGLPEDAGEARGCNCGHRLCRLCQRRQQPPEAPRPPEADDAGEDDGGGTPSSPAAAAAAASKARASWLAARLGSGGAGRAPVKLGPKGPCLTKRQALSLQSELHDGFADEDFQLDLRALASRQATFATHAEFARARQELLLQVQSKVLPEYGFPGTMSGIMQMMAAMGPFVRDPDIVRLGSEINELIGVDMPPDIWREVSKQCGDLRVDVAARESTVKEVKKRRDEQVKELRRREERRALGKDRSSLPAPIPIPKAWLGGDCGEDFAKASLQPFQGGAVASATGIGPFLQALPFPRWPSPLPPCCMSIIGSWSSDRPEPMQWMAGLFLHPVSVGPRGSERFQLLLGGRRDSMIYPSVDNANHLDDYAICGPDPEGEGRAWQVGKGYPQAEDDARPGARFAIVAAIDSGARVKLVGWQQY